MFVAAAVRTCRSEGLISTEWPEVSVRVSRKADAGGVLGRHNVAFYDANTTCCLDYDIEYSLEHHDRKLNDRPTPNPTLSPTPPTPPPHPTPPPPHTHNCTARLFFLCFFVGLSQLYQLARAGGPLQDARPMSCSRCGQKRLPTQAN